MITRGLITNTIIVRGFTYEQIIETLSDIYHANLIDITDEFGLVEITDEFIMIYTKEKLSLLDITDKYSLMDIPIIFSLVDITEEDNK